MWPLSLLLRSSLTARLLYFAAKVAQLRLMLVGFISLIRKTTMENGQVPSQPRICIEECSHRTDDYLVNSILSAANCGKKSQPLTGDVVSCAGSI